MSSNCSAYRKKFVIREVCDVHVLEGRDAAGLKESFVNSDGACIIQIGLSERRPASFRHARAIQHAPIVREAARKGKRATAAVRSTTAHSLLRARDTRNVLA